MNRFQKFHRIVTLIQERLKKNMLSVFNILTFTIKISVTVVLNVADNVNDRYCLFKIHF